MYKFYIIILNIILILGLCTSIYAEEYEIQTSSEDEIFSSEYIEVPSSNYINDNDNIVDYNVVRSVNPITPQDTSGLKSALLTVLGSYDAVVVEYQYQSSNGYYSYLREVQPDYVWIFSAILLIIIIFCLFRFLGGIFSGRC